MTRDEAIRTLQLQGSRFPLDVLRRAYAVIVEDADAPDAGPWVPAGAMVYRRGVCFPYDYFHLVPITVVDFYPGRPT